LECRRGSQAEAVAYCRKEEGRLDGPWQLGVLSKSAQGRRSDYHAVAEAVRDGAALATVAQESPAVFVRYYRGLGALADISFHHNWRNVDVFYIAGPTGSGKSSFVYDHEPTDHIYSLSSLDPLWFDGYTAQTVLLIDEFEAQLGHKALCRLLDGHAFRAPVKGSFVCARWTRVYIVGNLWVYDEFSAELKRRVTAKWWFSRSRGEYEDVWRWISDRSLPLPELRHVERGFGQFG